MHIFQSILGIQDKEDLFKLSFENASLIRILCWLYVITG
jgi:hypothetical protein